MSISLKFDRPLNDVETALVTDVMRQVEQQLAAIPELIRQEHDLARAALDTALNEAVSLRADLATASRLLRWACLSPHQNGSTRPLDDRLLVEVAAFLEKHPVPGGSKL